MLANYGFTLETDGLFGLGTQGAVKQFQATHGLYNDGIVGPLTWEALAGTSGADISVSFESNYSRNNSSLLKQLEEAKKYKGYIEEAAAKYKFKISVIAGIGSRESHWGLILNPPEPAGTGDYGHGRGLMQIDDRWHKEFINSGKWKNAGDNIMYGCDLLSGYYSFMRRMTNLEGTSLLRAALAGYNCGIGNALNAYRDGRDIDYYTSGRDYSKDVLSRAGFFQMHGWD